MKLSAPIYRLKREARQLARREDLPLHAALDRIARTQGFAAWSLLAARHAAGSPAEKLLARLAAGDLLLVGARPGQGKTAFALELAAAAARNGGHGLFFTLDYTPADVLEQLRSLGIDQAALGERFGFDCSNSISAGYITERLAQAPAGTVVAIDYLQVLDQRRSNPPLAEQVATLKRFAREHGVVIVCISQIDRSYDPAVKLLPDLDDIRLPNPLDLTLFNKACFLHAGKLQFQSAA